MAPWNPKANDIFLEALDIRGPEERQAFLDQACGADTELHGKVGALLAANERAGSFLEAPASGLMETLEELPLAEGLGTVIGPYQLLQQIGEGGMGTVFRAEQQHPVHRQVALKVIKPGMDSRQVIARFEAERQALALMDHLNIARVLDVGATENGRPFFVMELVHGVPITRYCDDNQLTPRERLELFVPVCQALQHAHQKGIIHRDVKPSNVMVTLYDGKPVPKVIDFGVAKATEQPLTEQTLVTQYGTIVGTLDYMSPEQAVQSALGVDTRSDIYSLGVLLYELLTGTTPLDRKRLPEAAVHEILRIIKEEEPPKPSTRLSSSDTLPAIATARKTEPAKLARLVRGDLDWIVMKALAKDRNERYATAQELAEDVKRFLDDRPVQARPPTFGDRARKWARRHKVLVRTAGVVLALAVVALAVGTVLLRAKNIELAAANEQEREQRQRADDNLGRANDAVEKFLVRVTSDPRLLQADLHELRRDLLASAVPFYEEFVKQKRDDPDLEWNRGRAFSGLTLLRQAMGDHEAAMHDCDQAQAIFSELARDHPDRPRYRQHLGSALNVRGNLLRETGKATEAETAYKDSLEIKEKLAADFPTEPQYQVDLGVQRNNLSLIQMGRGRLPEAAAGFRDAQKVLQPIVAGPSPSLEARQVLAGSHLNLGYVFYQQGNRAAETELLEALRIYKPLLEEYPTNSDYQREMGTAYNHLGNLYRDTQRPEEAVTAFLDTLKLYEPLAEKFPLVPNYRSQLGGTLSNLAMVRLNQSDPAEAQQLLERAIAHQRAALKINPRHPVYREFLSNHYAVLADVQVRRGQYATGVESAVELAGLRKENAEDAYDAAGISARCALLAEQDQKIADDKRRELAQRYGDQAMTLLREAMTRGYKDVEHMKQDDDLASLRKRADFQKVLAEMETKNPK